MQRLTNTSSVGKFWIIALALLGTLTACQDEKTGRPEQAIQATQATTGWQTVLPKGETTCSDGSEYKFFVRQGSSDKLMVYLQGGGGCWFRQSCDPDMQPSYTINLANTSYPNFGIFNFEKAENPFKHHSIVYAPYCTGDVHIGASDTVYPPVTEGQEDLVIRHQGRANMQAVLEWTYANIKNPKDIFVTGSSAGAIPSPLYASIIAGHYDNARVAQLGDGAGFM